MASKRGTTMKTGMGMTMKSRQSSPSPKVKKPPTRQIFGPQSQFRGVGNGIPGDPRK